MIIDVAARLFATKGLRQTTMESIAAEANRGRRTVYMYFSNKADIYEAVVQREIGRITDPLREVVRSESDFETLIRRYATERLAQLWSLMERNPLLLKDFSQGHSRVEKLRQRLNNDEIKLITPVFRRYLKDNIDHPHSCQTCYAVIFLNLLMGTDKLLTRENGHEEAMRITDCGTELFLKGIMCMDQPADAPVA
jgi:AcrR family transcriptional regulator